MRFIDTSNVLRRVFNCSTREGGSLTVEVDRSGDAPSVSIVLAKETHYMRVNARFDLDPNDLARVIAAVEAACAPSYSKVVPANFNWREGAHSLSVVADSHGEPFRYGVSFDYVEHRDQNGDFAGVFLEDREGQDLASLLRTALPSTLAA